MSTTFKCLEYGCLKQGVACGHSSSFGGDLGEILGVFQGLGLFVWGPRAGLMHATCDVALCCCGVVAWQFRMQQLSSTQCDPPVPSSPSVCLVLLGSPGLWTPGSVLCTLQGGSQRRWPGFLPWRRRGVASGRRLELPALQEGTWDHGLWLESWGSV